ncbi:MAG: sugar-binding transcriptional regulator [Actinobacteria bacterium]|nr:sugar-binding transcriptional regulator [Cyanobacteriota bacterium]MCL5771142.1 sugar-binding transcriptional regulator [Actinomycetota bacterium]
MENFDLDLIIKICNLKYIEKKQQKDIAKILKLSPAKVTRMLQKALDLEIIRFNIADINLEITKLESEIEKKFELKRMLIVKSNEKNEFESKMLVGQKISNYLLNILKDGDILGISHSSTVSEVIKALPIKIPKKVNVVQLLGGSYNLAFEGLDLTKELSDKFGVFPNILYAPLFVDNKKIKKAILSDSSIKNTFNTFKKVNIAIVGIGSFYPLGSSTIFKSGNLSQTEIDELIDVNVVGDIYGHFFDRNGHFCKTSVEDRIISIPVEYINRIEYRIGAASGVKKFEAIFSAIKGGLINILATDEKVAELLLNAHFKTPRNI